MHTLYFILLILGALCFAAATIGQAALTTGRRAIGLLPLGLLFWILVPLIQVGRTLH